MATRDLRIYLNESVTMLKYLTKSRSLLLMVGVLLIGTHAFGQDVALKIAKTEYKLDKKNPTFLHGMARKFSKKSKSFDFRAGKAGKFQVTIDPKAKVWVHDLTPLSEISEGTELHVLGRYTAALPGRQGGTLPPSVAGIIAVVVAPKGMFGPPTIDSKLKAQKYKWVKGKYRVDTQGRFIGSTQLTVGPRELVLVMREGKATEVTAKKQLMLWGTANSDDPKKKTFVAKLISKYLLYLTLMAMHY